MFHSSVAIETGQSYLSDQSLHIKDKYLERIKSLPKDTFTQANENEIKSIRCDMKKVSSDSKKDTSAILIKLKCYEDKFTDLQCKIETQEATITKLMS